MRVTDKVSIDKSILINVLQKCGVSFGESRITTTRVNGEVVITRTSDIAGELLCERGDESQPVREVRPTPRRLPFYIPQEVKEARVNWEVLYPKTRWAVYALAGHNVYHPRKFGECLLSSSTQAGLCENKYKIIDVTEFTRDAAVAEFLRLSREHEKVRLFGISHDARLVNASGTFDVNKYLFICVY